MAFTYLNLFAVAIAVLFFNLLIFYNTMNIFVASLPFSADDQDLREIFEPFGEVTSAKVIFDRDRNRSKGFGFVEMADDASAQNAINELHESSYEGRNIVVKVAEDRPHINLSSFHMKIRILTLACILATTCSMAQNDAETSKKPLKLLTSIEHSWVVTNYSKSRSLGLNANILLNRRLSVGIHGGRSYWQQPYKGDYYTFSNSRLGASCGIAAVSRTKNWFIPNLFIGQTLVRGSLNEDALLPNPLSYPNKIKLPHHTLGFGLNYYHLFSKNEKGALLGLHARYHFSPKETQWVTAGGESFSEVVKLGVGSPSSAERLSQFSFGVSLGFGTRIQRNEW